MFLQTLLRDNPTLGDYALHLHKRGLIQPDTYVLDADEILKNALAFRQKAEALGITPYPMTKQIGRNPHILALLRSENFAFCTVDFREALSLAQEGCRLGHVGHLVQMPQALIPRILEYRPEYWTVYSLEQASALNEAAKGLGVKQKILLRPLAEAYPGQESSFHSPESLLAFAKSLSPLKNLTVCGLTSFPCFLYQNNAIEANANALLLDKCFDTLREEGFALDVKNMPSQNCLEALPLMHAHGATHGEPGHALTGTCPSHAAGGKGEKIALCYVTEISHRAEGKSYAFGGGWYRRSQWKKAVIGGKEAVLCPPQADNIDYTYAFEGDHPIGAGVLASFRTQIFTTRSQTAAVGGISEGKPRLLGLSDALGRSL